jgi:hypothetical protein
VARAILLWALLLAPIGAIAGLVVASGRAEAGTWLLFVPLTFAWLAGFDLKYGRGARLSRPPRDARIAQEPPGQANR